MKVGFVEKDDEEVERRKEVVADDADVVISKGFAKGIADGGFTG